ncbi:MAG: hypothetical protein J4F34_06505 [Gemmatimonadetes bacterium]|nr:hypothetical protein [Gemmatimonadota bacterium]
MASTSWGVGPMPRAPALALALSGCATDPADLPLGGRWTGSADFGGDGTVSSVWVSSGHRFRKVEREDLRGDFRQHERSVGDTVVVQMNRHQ